MRDPYEILGVPRGSGMDRVNAAYRELARKYQDSDPKKMDEINAAYDAIAMDSRARRLFLGGQLLYLCRHGRLLRYQSQDQRQQARGRSCSSTAYPRACATRSGITSRAPFSRKGAGLRRRRIISAEPATWIRPTTPTKWRSTRSIRLAPGGYRAERRKDSDSGCSACDICSGLMCADCCCECFGGDLIPCC